MLAGRQRSPARRPASPDGSARASARGSRSSRAALTHLQPCGAAQPLAARGGSTRHDSGASGRQRRSGDSSEPRTCRYLPAGLAAPPRAAATCDPGPARGARRARGAAPGRAGCGPQVFSTSARHWPRPGHATTRGWGEGADRALWKRDFTAKTFRLGFFPPLCLP